MSNKKSISIIGATGNLGVPVVKNLVDFGYTVQAIVRNREKAQQLFSHLPQVQLAEADLRDIPALKAALKQTEYLYLSLSTQIVDLNTPFVPEREGVANILAAADQARLRQIMALSGLGAFDNHASPAKKPFIPNIIRKQGHQLIKESGIPYTLLHATWFADSFVLFRRKLTYPVIGDTRHPIYFTNAYDFARHIDHALGNPQAFYKEFPIQGFQGLTHPEAAQVFLSVYAPQTQVKPLPAGLIKVLALFNKEMKFVSHMSDYFRSSHETFVAEDCGTYNILGKPTLSLTDYAQKLKNDKFYHYLTS